MTIKRFRCFLIIGLLALFAGGCSSPPKIEAVLAVVGQATYRSDQGVTIDATYYANNTVRLKFSNGETRVLPIAISGSGARYANDCCEWWEHQGEATYAIDGKAVFVGKI
jgi:membrane-bound inhibitor of C-type lysozyme